MEVQFFKQPELKTINDKPENVARLIELSEKLGIALPDNDKQSEVINIYRPLNSYEVNCLEVLCKGSCPLKNYDITPIPLEILEEVMILTENKVFEEFIVLHSVDDPDPIIIAKKYRNEKDRADGYSWKKQSFIVARWGDQAKPFEQLISEAVAKARAKVRKQLVEVLVNLKAWEGREDDLTEKLLTSGSNEAFYISTK